MEGYIKLHRKIIEWEWYDDINTKVLFFHLLLICNYQEQKWRGKNILPGQRVTSYSTLSKETGLSVRSIRTSLDKLEKTGEVTRETTSEYTILTLNNWCMYNMQNDKPTTSDRQTKDKPTTSDRQQYKKDNKEKKEKKIETLEKTEVFSSVFLSIEEIEKLKLVYGPRYQNAIEKLSAYKNSTGKKYKSDYHTLIPSGWVHKAMKDEYPDLGKTQVDLEAKKLKEENEKQEKKRIEQEKRDADNRNAELEKFYKNLPEEIQKQITSIAEQSLSNISQKARDDFPENYKIFLQNKRRQITEYYKNTGKLIVHDGIQK